MNVDFKRNHVAPSYNVRAQRRITPLLFSIVQNHGCKSRAQLFGSRKLDLNISTDSLFSNIQPRRRVYVAIVMMSPLVKVVP